MSNQYEVTTDEKKGQLLLVFRGVLEPETVKEAAAALDEALSGLGAEKPNLVVDLRELSGCNVFARSELATLQRDLTPRVRRTAYISSRPRFRGLGLWVIHLSDSKEAKSVISEEAIESWFASTETRVDGFRERTLAKVGRLATKGKA